MLLLIVPDGDQVGMEQQDVGRHQNRIRVEAQIRWDPLVDLVLVLRHAIENARRCQRAENPGKFGVLRYLTLHVEQ